MIRYCAELEPFRSRRALQSSHICDDAVSLGTIHCELSWSLVSAVYKAFHFFPSTFLLKFSVSIVIPLTVHNSVGGTVLHFFFFAHWTTIPKYIPVCQNMCDLLCPKRASVLHGGPLKEVIYKTECDISYCKLLIPEFCTCRLVLWSHLQMNLLHWDQTQNFRGGSYIVYSHRNSPNV